MQINSMIAGIDFSQTSTNGAAWAAQQFAPLAALTLVHIIDAPHRHLDGDRAPAPSSVEAAAQASATRRLAELAQSIGRQPARCEVCVGPPHETMVSLAGEIGADLIVIGPHDERREHSMFLGSTADRIVRTSPVPVLVATQPPEDRPRRILVPVDDIGVTPTLMQWTRALAEAFDADVQLLHVWSNAVYSHVASMALATEPSEDAAQAEISREMHDAGQQWLKELAQTGLERPNVTATVSYGDAGEATLEAATTMSADLIVLGRHRSGLIAPALLGSTIGTVLHGARCPVLVVTEQPDQP